MILIYKFFLQILIQPPGEPREVKVKFEFRIFEKSELKVKNEVTRTVNISVIYKSIVIIVFIEGVKKTNPYSCGHVRNFLNPPLIRQTQFFLRTPTTN